MTYLTKQGLDKDFELFYNLGETLREELSMLEQGLGRFGTTSCYNLAKEQHKLLAQINVVDGHLRDISKEYVEFLQQ